MLRARLLFSSALMIADAPSQADGLSVSFSQVDTCLVGKAGRYQTSLKARWRRTRRLPAAVVPSGGEDSILT